VSLSSFSARRFLPRLYSGAHLRPGISPGDDPIGRRGGREGRANFSTTRLTKEGLARMEDEASYTNFGHLIIADDVPEDLLAGKISSMTNFGSVTGPENLVRLLEGRCDTNFGSFGADDDDEDDDDEDGDSKGPKLSNLGMTILTREQLSNMEDATKFTNLGELTVSDDVPAELLSRKIGEYHNLGKTSGPAALLGVLQARCSENLGKFSPTGERRGRNGGRAGRVRG